MDKEYVSPLKRQFLHLNQKPNLPDTADGLQNKREFVIQSVRDMVEQTQRGKWATVKVRRERSTITINWTMHPGQPDGIGVGASVAEIEFDQKPDYIETNAVVANTTGTGGATVELEEGGAYLIRIAFLRLLSMDDLKNPSGLTDLVVFHVAIPLTPESRQLMRRSQHLQTNPDERVRHEFQQFQRKRNALDEERQAAIARVKARGLPPEEESELIADIEDFAKSLRDRFGV